MRQAGIIAAAGIVALETMVDRLAEDHALAKVLAEGLSRIDGVSLEKNSPQTNMVFIRLDQRVSVSDAEFEKQLKERGVLLNGTGPRTFRLVTHHDVGLEEVNRCVEAIKAVLN